MEYLYLAGILTASYGTVAHLLIVGTPNFTNGDLAVEELDIQQPPGDFHLHTFRLFVGVVVPFDLWLGRYFRVIVNCTLALFSLTKCGQQLSYRQVHGLVCIAIIYVNIFNPNWDQETSGIALAAFAPIRRTCTGNFFVSFLARVPVDSLVVLRYSFIGVWGVAWMRSDTGFTFITSVYFTLLVFLTHFGKPYMSAYRRGVVPGRGLVRRVRRGMRVIRGMGQKLRMLRVF